VRQRASGSGPSTTGGDRALCDDPSMTGPQGVARAGTGDRTMRAVRLVRAGGSVVPRVVEVPAPAAPTGTHVLVRVAASSVNGSDLGLLHGGRLLRALGASRVAPGFDVAGEVIARGTGRDGLRRR
jgi:hypothetical protein